MENELKKYEDTQIKIEIKGEILWGKYKPGVIIDKDVSSRMVSKRLELSKGKSHFLIGDFRGVKYWTINSMNHDMKEKAFDLAYSSALIVSSKVHKILWDFATSLFNPPIPTKIFYSEKEAEIWIKEEIKRIRLTDD